jgi:hypothetical protein
MDRTTATPSLVLDYRLDNPGYFGASEISTEFRNNFACDWQKKLEIKGKTLDDVILIIGFDATGFVTATYGTEGSRIDIKYPITAITVKGVDSNMLSYTVPGIDLYDSVNNPTGREIVVNFYDPDDNGPAWFDTDLIVTGPDTFDMAVSHSHGAVDGTIVPVDETHYMHIDGFWNNIWQLTSLGATKIIALYVA